MLRNWARKPSNPTRSSTSKGGLFVKVNPLRRRLAHVNASQPPHSIPLLQTNRCCPPTTRRKRASWTCFPSYLSSVVLGRFVIYPPQLQSDLGTPTKCLHFHLRELAMLPVCVTARVLMNEESTMTISHSRSFGTWIAIPPSFDTARCSSKTFLSESSGFLGGTF